MNNFEQFEKRSDEKWERELDAKVENLLSQYHNFQKEEGETKLEYLIRKKKIVSKIIDTYIVIKIEEFGFDKKGYKRDFNIKQYEFAELSYLVEEEKRKQSAKKSKLKEQNTTEKLNKGTEER